MSGDEKLWPLTPRTLAAVRDGVLCCVWLRDAAWWSVPTILVISQSLSYVVRVFLTNTPPVRESGRTGMSSMLYYNAREYQQTNMYVCVVWNRNNITSVLAIEKREIESETVTFALQEYSTDPNRLPATNECCNGSGLILIRINVVNRKFQTGKFHRSNCKEN